MTYQPRWRNPPQYHSKAAGEVLGTRKGRGAKMISPSASLLQAMLYVGSTNKVMEIPMDMCWVYRNNCDSCLLARDPYCGWFNGSCQSVYLNRYVVPTACCFSTTSCWLPHVVLRPSSRH